MINCIPNFIFIFFTIYGDFSHQLMSNLPYTKYPETSLAFQNSSLFFFLSATVEYWVTENVVFSKLPRLLFGLVLTLIIMSHRLHSCTLIWCTDSYRLLNSQNSKYAIRIQHSTKENVTMIINTCKIRFPFSLSFYMKVFWFMTKVFLLNLDLSW